MQMCLVIIIIKMGKGKNERCLNWDAMRKIETLKLKLKNLFGIQAYFWLFCRKSVYAWCSHSRLFGIEQGINRKQTDTEKERVAFLLVKNSIHSGSRGRTKTITFR